MICPNNMDEAKDVISNAEAVKFAKHQLEHYISDLISKFEVETGFVVHEIYLNKSYAAPSSVTVEARV